MTDKETIIDGVDVAECEDYGYRGKAGYWCHYHDEPCTDYLNCCFKQLKAENDELKEKVEELRQGWINCDKERNLQEANSEFNQRVINRYKQALSSIRNIAEEDFNHTCWEAYAGQLKQILQKISEVENE